MTAHQTQPQTKDVDEPQRTGYDFEEANFKQAAKSDGFNSWGGPSGNKPRSKQQL